MAEISEVFNQPGAAFVLLREGQKYPPIETGWQNKSHNFQEATEHAARGGNVGILAGNGFIGLDQDNPEAFKGLELPISTTWETRPGRLGMWFKCFDVAEALVTIGKKPDQAQLKLFQNGTPCGEVKLERTYQATPPSWKILENGQRADYKLLQKIPPAEISLTKLLSDLQSIGVMFSSKLEQNAARLESMGKEARQKRSESDESRTRRYAEAALEDEVLAVAGSSTGNRNTRLNEAAFALGQFVATGVLSEAEVTRELSRAAMSAGLELEEIRATIASGLEAGGRHPREIPAPGRRVESGTGTDAGRGEISECDPCDVHELVATFKKWLYIKEDYNITAPFTGIIANFCEGSPDIIGIIGPSGSTKTEFIRSLGETQNEYVYPVSTITEHTLVSGHKDSRDLVPQLRGRILAIKDLTSILSRKEDVRAAIFADFRELTDEYIRKEFGNGIAKEYRDIHSSILFASTNAIERYYSMYSNLGQRMIFIRPENDPKEARKRASENRGKQKEMRAELHAVTKRFIASMLQVKERKGLPTTPDDIQEEMGILYDFLAIARTTIHHDFKTGDIDELPEPEFPTRIANTVGRLCEVHALFYGRDEVNDEDMAFGCRIISDNLPTMRWKVLRSLTKEWQHTAKIAQVADLPPRSAKYHLDELVALKLAEKLLKDEADSSMDHRFDYFKLSDLAADAIEKYDTRIRTDGIIREEQSKLIDKQNISLPNPCVVLSGGDGEGATSAKDGPSPTMGKIDRPTPGLEKFRAGMAKRQCCLCGRSFPYDLTPYVGGGKRGHICATCHMQGPPPVPAKADSQTKLEGGQ